MGIIFHSVAIRVEKLHPQKFLRAPRPTEQPKSGQSSLQAVRERDLLMTTT